ncbi:hypothetical protein [Exiguobacterium acetylicum]|uniref:hypothetical protein n=1 Tax=Exiguobacterium acetylicum TaxID=41170 RepID=UPI003018776B
MKRPFGKSLGLSLMTLTLLASPLMTTTPVDAASSYKEKQQQNQQQQSKQREALSQKIINYLKHSNKSTPWINKSMG